VAAEFEWCWPGDEQTIFCRCRVGADTTLCGRDVGVVPVLFQPVVSPPLDRQCPVCRRRFYGPADYKKPVEKRPAEGVCPACDGWVPVRGGLVLGHGAWKQGPDGPYESDERCVGVNLPPKPRRRR
jgi:hypothetical protein